MSKRTVKVYVSYLVPGIHAADRLTEHAHIEALAASLRQGQREPLLVRPVNADKDSLPDLEVVQGERRRQAAELAGLRMIEVIVDDGIDDVAARRQSAEHNAGTSNPLERAEGVLRTVNAHLAGQPQWRRLAEPFASPHHAVMRLLTLAIRKQPEGLEQACAKLGLAPHELKAIAGAALDLYYGPGKRALRTFVGGDAHLVTYPEALRAALRLEQLGASHAQAINSVQDEALRDELLELALSKRTSVTSLRALALAANRTGRLERDQGVADLEDLHAQIGRALAKSPQLQARAQGRALTLATKLRDLLQRHA